MASDLTKGDWIILALKVAPLDRIRLMKTLFLVWHDADQEIPHFFEFTRYLYGPCSFELYSELDKLQGNGLVVQPPSSVPKWAKYYLTKTGLRRGEGVQDKIDPKYMKLIEKNATLAAKTGFRNLLAYVYRVAPAFARNSVVEF